MPQKNWYDPQKHQRFEAVPDFNQVAPTDVIGAYEAFEQRRREREVKLAHLQYIEDKLEKCSLFNGVHNVFQECRHLIAEYEQTKNELMGWKEGSPLPDPLYKPGNKWNSIPGNGAQ